MTTPVERTRAIRLAGELLQDLRKRQDVPEDIRARALGVLRHYPEEWQLRMMAEEWQRQNHSMLSQGGDLAPEPDRPDPLETLKIRPL